MRTNWSVGGEAVFIAAAALLFASVAGKLLGVSSRLQWQPGEASIIGWLLQTKALIMIISLATWQAGGSVLFTSTNCTAGAHVFSSPYAGVRAGTPVQTPAGIMLHVGGVGTATTMAIHSILYDTGCAPVTVQQNGLLPVLATVNLNTAYPAPLSFQ